ncbi:MAG: V-type ATP synthase subunit E family protein [Candidatus Nanosalina sp.]
MGLEDVKNEIITEAKQEKKQILEEAEEEKQKILDEAEEKADSIREDAEEEIKEDKEAIRKRTVSNANMEAKKTKLNAKHEELEEVFKKFRERLSNLNKDEKQKFVKNAVSEVDFDVGEILGSSDFKEAVQDYDFSEIDQEGIILVSVDGERRVNYTFDKIKEDFRENHRKEIAKILFD